MAYMGEQISFYVGACRCWGFIVCWLAGGELVECQWFEEPVCHSLRSMTCVCRFLGHAVDTYRSISSVLLESSLLED